MNAVKIGLQVLLVLASLFLIMLILLHKGKGGGLSDMFGGGHVQLARGLVGRGAQPRPVHRRPSASSGSSSILGLGLLARFAG